MEDDEIFARELMNDMTEAQKASLKGLNDIDMAKKMQMELDEKLAREFEEHSNIQENPEEIEDEDLRRAIEMSKQFK